jgi:hypothetical protein
VGAVRHGRRVPEGAMMIGMTPMQSAITDMPDAAGGG